MFLYPHQIEALKKLKSGSILNGGVGSGKTITSLIFYKENFKHLDLYVITTAKKRDTGDWEEDASKIGVTIKAVDSWSNIQNYISMTNCFFIFDEQRVVGYSTWGKSFIKICKSNKWILLTATPGDTWMDYMTTFIANGFYRNKSDFIDQHVEFDQWVKYPKIKTYHNVSKLMRHRREILVPMDFQRSTVRKRKYIHSAYDEDKYKIIMNDRWNIFKEEPIETGSELMSCLRKITSTDQDRIFNAKVLIDIHPRIIVFYNFNYERDILLNIVNELDKPYGEWNGHNHDDIPDTDEWVYIVQYTAGAEGWNCISTNVILFYSMNYSFKIIEQAEGRIDRLNTEFKELHYYYLLSNSKSDKNIFKAVKDKKKFNENAWIKRSGISW